ncbi:MAG: hypothetical protein GX592_05740 [Clostridiales bacterium]|nr:hypothetical protein [Clostridiales bacterium]
MINHCEKPMTLGGIKGCVHRCRELEMLSFVCADTTEEAMAVAQFHPGIMNPEPSELIGSGQSADMTYVTRTVNAVKAIDPGILTEIAAGITKPQDVYDYIMAGSDAAGAAWNGNVSTAASQILVCCGMNSLRGQHPAIGPLAV